MLSYQKVGGELIAQRVEGQWPLGYKGRCEGRFNREVGHDIEHMAVALRQYRGEGKGR